MVRNNLSRFLLLSLVLALVCVGIVWAPGGFYDAFTAGLDPAWSNNTVSNFSLSVGGGQVLLNKTSFVGVGEGYLYTSSLNASTTSAFSISVFVNLSNTSADAQGNYGINSGILVYNRTSFFGSVGCRVGYISGGVGLKLLHFNNTPGAPPSITSASRSYGTLTYTYDNVTGIFNCSLDDGNSISGPTNLFGPGMGIGVVSQLSQAGGPVSPNGSVTAYFDNFNYTIGNGGGTPPEESVDWDDFTVFTSGQPYAMNGPGCYQPGQSASSTVRQPGDGCTHGIVDDLGAVWVDMDDDYIAWQVIGPFNSSAKFCNSSGNVNIVLMVEFDADNNLSTGCNGGCYNGADYKVVLQNGSGVFKYYNASAPGDHMTTNESVDVYVSTNCDSGRIRFAINKDAIQNLRGMRFQTNTATFVPGFSLHDSLGGYGDDLFMRSGSQDFMFEDEHPCRGIEAQVNCTSSSNVSGQIFNCFWDDFKETCNPDFRNGLGGEGMTCDDFCGACNTSDACSSGGKGKCTDVGVPPNTPSFAKTWLLEGQPRMCVEDMTKFSFNTEGSCDDDCGYCFSETQCNSSTYPSPTGGNGCKWITDSAFGRSWCEVSTFSESSLNCGATSLQRCFSEGDCTGAGGTWDAEDYYCKGAGEICFNGEDDDTDNLIDCFDSNCSMDPFCGGEINLLTGGYVVDLNNPIARMAAMQQEMFGDADPSPPVILKEDPDDGVRADLEIEALGTKDMGAALGVGIMVESMADSILCGGSNLAYYEYFLDVDANSSSGCVVNVSGTEYPGFEYFFDYGIGDNGIGGYLELRRAYRCINGNFSLYPVKLMGAPNLPGVFLPCDMDVAIIAIDKADIGNPKGNLRWIVATTDENGLFESANDSITEGKPGEDGVYYTPGAADFKPKDCFANPMACGTAFGVIGQGKFMPFEDCFLGNTNDEDLDGAVNCDDSDCQMAPWCAGTYNASNDKTAPTVTSSNVQTFGDSVFINWMTNEPVNGTVQLYSSASCASPATNTFYEIGDPNCVGENCDWDDYMPFRFVPIMDGDQDSLSAPVSISATTTYYYKLTSCDKAGNCAVSGCLNFTTASGAQPVPYKFDFVPPAGNPMMENTAIQLFNGTAWVEVVPGAENELPDYLTDASIKFDDEEAGWEIEFTGVDLSKTLDLNLSGGINVSNVSGDSYVGMQNQKWLEFAQSLGVDSINITIPGDGEVLMKCNEGDFEDCVDVTDATLGHGIVDGGVEWEIPISLGFSVYTVIAEDNTTTTYNLTFINQSALTSTIAGGVNATYNLTVFNGENMTRVYNLTLVTTSGASSRINSTTLMQINVTNESYYDEDIIVDVNSTVSGVYYTTILATLADNASIVLNSSDDGITLVTIVDATAPTITLNTQNNSWTSNNQSSLNFTVVDAVSASTTCDLYVDGTLVNESLSVSNNTATLITPNVTLAEGVRTWYVNCTDLYDNEGTSNPRILNIDKTAPTVRLVTPNATWSTSATPSFTFNYTDASTASCTLYVEGDATGTNSSVTNNTNTAITANTSLDQGSNTWYVNCTDQAGNVGTPGYTMTVLVDSIYPTALVNNINGVSTGYGTTNATLTVNYTANDTNIINWTLAVYNSTWGLLQNWTATTNNLSALQTYTATANGTYYVNLTVRDNATNVNTTTFTIYVDQVDPAINSLSTSSVTSSGATLTVNATDSVSGIDSCTYSGAGSGTLSLSSGLYTASITGRSASTSYTVVVECTDLAGNSVTNQTTFTTSASSSSSSSGGGATGASGGVSSGASGSFQQENWVSVNKGETATLNVADAELGITEVSFQLDKTMYGIWLRVSKVTSLPKDVTPFTKKVYKYLEVTKSVVFKEGDFKNAAIEFKVEKAWLTQNKLTAENIVLYRYVNGKWTELKTTMGRDDGKYLQFSAETPGFSYFLIGEKAVIVSTSTAPETPVTENVPIVPSLTEEAPAVTGSSSNWKWIVGILVLLFVILVIISLLRKRSKPQQLKKNK
jgi:PGF-pre-PGF domain-containing protein